MLYVAKLYFASFPQICIGLAASTGLNPIRGPTIYFLSCVVQRTSFWS